MEMMMLQMDKISELCGAYNDVVSAPHYTHDHQNSPPFLNLNPQTISFSNSSELPENKRSSMTAMREMIFRIASMQLIHIVPESVKAPKRRNVKISKDPQSVAARHRRERISERIRILQRLVPGGTKMDTASMLDDAIHYVKFLKSQVQTLEKIAVDNNTPAGIGFPVAMSSGNNHYKVSGCMGKGYATAPTTAQQYHQNVQHYGDA